VGETTPVAGGGAVNEDDPSLVEAVPLVEPVSLVEPTLPDVPTPSEVPPPFDGLVPCAVDVSDDDPSPHPVNIPPMISDPATTSVHERTLALFIGTPRQKTPFQMRLVRRSATNRTGAGLFRREVA
jgi:hypothetical protein